ncbi:hypothetical protein M8C21_012684 [Ambrosia artemisiifolia]|uniref:Uncharacterized protein n=1 Tax=Ambrosia artemisiifolia TaxID=4212 RepID=A0AAD5GD14_AMBAR|nr:hypothetical protein M8C21_012684 [Ambrosia artemisiifolia]
MYKANTTICSMESS